MYYAIIVRALSGVLNGNIGVVKVKNFSICFFSFFLKKTYLGEITDRTNQAKAFGLVGFSWGFGSIGSFISDKN